MFQSNSSTQTQQFLDDTLLQLHILPESATSGYAPLTAENYNSQSVYVAIKPIRVIIDLVVDFSYFRLLFPPLRLIYL